MIRIEKLRKDLIEDDMGAFFGGGYGGALIDSFDIEHAPLEKLIEIARRKGINLNNYMEDDDEYEY